MIKIKSNKEIEIMRKSGEISNKALKEALMAVKEGISTLELDAIAENEIIKSGGSASFKTVDDYEFATCININEGIVHGKPNNYRLKKGDLVSIDLGALYEGFHSDLSYTVEVGTNNEESFLKTGLTALEKAIRKVKIGNKIGDISHVIQTEVEKKGYSVSQMLVGHGIGRELHEDPYVPCYGEPNTGPKLKEGMVFAVEVIYQKGDSTLRLADDGWTLETNDKSLSGLFEKTVAVTKNGPLLITNF